MPSMARNDLITSVNEAKAYSQSFILWPRQWQKYLSSHIWQPRKLERSRTNEIPDSSGIYTLTLHPGIAGHPSCAYLMYVGKAVSLRRRFSEYLGKERRESGRPKIFDFLHRYSPHIWFYFTIVESRSLTSVENRLLDSYLPPLNNQFKGKIGRVMRAF